MRRSLHGKTNLQRSRGSRIYRSVSCLHSVAHLAADPRALASGGSTLTALRPTAPCAGPTMPVGSSRPGPVRPTDRGGGPTTSPPVADTRFASWRPSSQPATTRKNSFSGSTRLNRGGIRHRSRSRPGRPWRRDARRRAVSGRGLRRRDGAAKESNLPARGAALPPVLKTGRATGPGPLQVARGLQHDQ